MSQSGQKETSPAVCALSLVSQSKARLKNVIDLQVDGGLAQV
jgi:hypothetical protein